jgi:hypothetical protein
MGTSETVNHTTNLASTARQIKLPNLPREAFLSVALPPHPSPLIKIGGGGGIRTHGPLQVSSFQDWRNRPLYHPSGTLRIERPP